jgi:hypothetical protein
MTSANNSSDSVLAQITEVCDDVLDAWAGHISTHHVGCWKRHVACLALRVKTLMEEADD